MAPCLRLENKQTHLQTNNNLAKPTMVVVPSPNAPKPPPTATIKLLCSYGGRILPRYPDGKLRYHGGHTRVLAVNRSISFSELMAKLGELCGKPVSLRCRLPTEDLDALVSVTSDEDLVNLVEEYDRAGCLQPSPLKIRAFLSLPKKRSPSPPPSTTATASASGSGSSSSSIGSPKSPPPPPSSDSYPAARSRPNRCVHQTSKPPPKQLPLCYNGRIPWYAHRNPYSDRSCLVHNGNHWQ